MAHDLDSHVAGPESPFAEPSTGGSPGKSPRSAAPVQRRAAADVGGAAAPPPASSGGDDPFGLHLKSSGPAALETATRSQMEGSFGTSFADVNVHADSPQASGSTQAFTQGNDVHFAAGQYQPGSSSGNWLIAHELAHVVQQSGGSPAAQRFDRSEPGLGHEADADQAADAAVAGQPAVVRLSTRAGARQNYEAWEHRALGDANGGDRRTVTVDCGITLTYGQVVALSGDFYRSPEALMSAPRAELERILAVMDRERTQAGATAGNGFGTGAPTPEQIVQNNDGYERATEDRLSRARHHDHESENPFLDDHEGGADHDHDHDDHDHEHGHGIVTDGGHVEDNGPSGGAAPGAEGTFLGLADNNASHFSPENINLNFKPKHQLAIDLAKEAWRARNPGGTPGAAGGAAPAGAGAPGAAAATPAPAGAAPATPAGAAPAGGAPAARPAAPAGGAAPPGSAAPAAGGAVPVGAATPDANTVSTRTGSSDAGERKEAMAILSDGFAVHFLTDAFASGHLVSGSVGRTIGAAYYTAHTGQIRTALTACFNRDFPAASLALGPAAVMGIIAGMAGLISTKSGSLTLKLVHDYFNKNGVTVKNKETEWTTVGDANLSSSPITQVQGSLAATASREGIDKAVRDGELSDADRDKPLDYVPTQARFADGPFQSIEAFCADATIFDAVLSRTMLSPDPATNELWRLVKANAAPTAATLLRQGGQWAGDLVTGAYNAAARGARAVGGAIRDGAVAAGGAIRDGAVAVRDGAVAAGGAIRDGAVAAGGAIRDGAVAAGGAIRDGAVAAGGAVRDGAVAVRDGAVAAGGAIADGARAAGGAIADGASAAGSAVAGGARRGAAWVSSWFD